MACLFYDLYDDTLPEPTHIRSLFLYQYNDKNIFHDHTPLVCIECKKYNAVASQHRPLSYYISG